MGISPALSGLSRPISFWIDGNFLLIILCSFSYKKNLKALYLVHPSKFIKILWGIFKPFISYKFERKMHYCNFIDELNVVVRIERLRIPKPISEYFINIKIKSFKVMIKV